MKFYKLNDTWVSWDELHNGYGYTTGPSIAVTYKSAHNGSSWGEDAGSGYYVGDIDDMVHGSFWCDSDYGWFDLDGLVWNPEIYPSNATPLMMQNGGLTSQAVSLESDGVTYYLIKAIVADTGWITADEAAELGWEVYDEPQGTFIVFDTVENKIVSAFTNELTYGEIEGIVLQSPRLVYGVDISVPVRAFWFTDNGRAETNNRSFDVNGNPLFNADGSFASDEIYDHAIPIAFTKENGNMFNADTNADYIRHLPTTQRLTCVIPSGSTTRGKSAWSVQVAKLFVLSYANAQLPDVQIELPINEVGEYGTQITLPTIDGEYESGGKTWKPSAWDIGAFGSSYTLNADTVAHLIFEEVQQYQEITLYMASGDKQAQKQVTSGFTGNVNATYCYQLYVDEQLTTPWTGYDYSNDYELGNYSGGVWIPWTRTSVSSLPDTYTSDSTQWKMAYILMDNGFLWLASNVSGSGYMSYPSRRITVRIYPKGQQYYAAYFNQTNTYANQGVTSTGGGVQKPNAGGQYIQTPHQFPTITLQKVLGSAGNEITGNLSVNQGADFTRFTLNNNTGTTIAIRVAIYTLEYKTFYHWLKSDGTDMATSSGTAYPLMDLGGEIIEFDNDYDYFPIGLIQYNGKWATSTQTYLNDAKMGAFDPDHPTWLCFKQVSGTLSMSCVWYYKKLKPIEVNFGDPVTIPAGYSVQSVKCSRGYVFASSVSRSSAQVNYNLPGEKVYFDDTNTALVGVGVKPALTIAAMDGNGSALMFLSTRPDMSSSLILAQAEKVNSRGSFVKGMAAFSTSSTASSVQTAMQARPVYFNLTDSAGNWLYFCFRVPQTLWQFQNGVFSWLGDTTDTSDLAYWYNGRGVRIHCIAN